MPKQAIKYKIKMLLIYQIIIEQYIHFIQARKQVTCAHIHRIRIHRFGQIIRPPRRGKKPNYRVHTQTILSALHAPTNIVGDEILVVGSFSQLTFIHCIHIFRKNGLCLKRCCQNNRFADVHLCALGCLKIDREMLENLSENLENPPQIDRYSSFFRKERASCLIRTQFCEK